MKRILQFFSRRPYVLFLAPALFFYTCFWILPAVGSLGISFTHWNGISWSQMSWAGLANYLELFGDRFFWGALANNLKFVSFAVGIILTVALSIAILLSLRPKLSRLFETILFLPMVLSSVVIGLIFGLIFSPTSGFLSSVGEFLHIDGLGYLQLLGDKRAATYAILSVYIWQQIGFSILLIGAGVRAVPKDYMDAARIDGAKPFTVIRKIVIPLSRDVLVVALVLAVINAFLMFDLVFIMTNGGPFHASEVLSTYMYQQAFALGRTSYGAAIAMVLFVVVLSITAIQLALTRFGNR